MDPALARLSDSSDDGVAASPAIALRRKRAPWLPLVTDNRQEGVFVGLWVPSILAAGSFWITAVRRA